MTLFTLQAIAREAVGKDRPHKEVDDWCNEVWGKPVSPGVNTTPMRKRRQEDWVERLARADGRGKRTRKEDACIDTRIIEENKCEREIDDENLDMCKQRTSKSEQKAKSRLRVFGSVTNVLADPFDSLARPAPANNMLIPSNASAGNLCAPLFSFQETVGPLHGPLGEPLREEILKKPTPLILVDKDLLVTTTRTINPTGQSNPTNNSSFTPTLNQLPSTIPKCRYSDTPLGQFLDTAVVWLLRRPGLPRPSWRVPSSHIIRPGHQVHSFDAFIMACGWSQTVVSPSPSIDSDCKNGIVIAACGWAERGVLFVDESFDDSDSSSDDER